MAAIGVHLGNSSACVAVYKNGKVDIIANSHGDRLTPAMVTFLKDETMVGFAAKQASRKHLEETVLHSNQFLGKQINDKLTKELMQSMDSKGVPIRASDDGSLLYSLTTDGKTKSYTPIDISKLIFQDIMVTAQSQVGADVNEAVLTAPVAFLSSYRDALDEAASAAGFEVLRIISRPAAAAIAYGIGIEEHTEEPYNVVIFTVGGVSQNVTLIEVCSGIMSVKKHISRNNGGDVLTSDIANHFASLFERKFKTSLVQHTKAMTKLKIQAEKCKHVLSTMPSASCHIDSLHDGMDFNCDISRSRFEMLVNDHLTELVLPMKELLFNSEVDISKIHKVIMCGGTSNIPKLQSMVSNLLPNAELLRSIPPAEVIAIGAATEGSLLVGQNSLDLADDDCHMILSPVNIYVCIFDSTDLVLKAQTPLPCSADREYTIPQGQDDCRVEIMFAQNIGTNLEKNKLAEVHMENVLPGSTMSIHLKYLSNGHLVVTCLDNANGASKSVTLSS